MKKSIKGIEFNFFFFFGGGEHKKEKKYSTLIQHSHIYLSFPFIGNSWLPSGQCHFAKNLSWL